MANCKNCEHDVFDIVWGECKCEVHKKYVYDTEAMENCEDFKQGTPKESKEGYEHYER